MSSSSDHSISDCAWVELRDEKNKRYYFNKEENCTVWNMPEAYREWRDMEIDKYLKTTKWRRQLREGKFVYYDKESKNSQWETPDLVNQYKDFLATLSRERRSKKRNISESPVVIKVDERHVSAEENTLQTHQKSKRDVDDSRVTETIEVQHPIISAAVSIQGGEISTQNWATNHSVVVSKSQVPTHEVDNLTIEKASQHLAMKDSLMDINIIASLQTLLQHRDGPSPLEAIKRLSQSYSGSAQMVRIVLELLRLSNSLSSSSVPPSASSTSSTLAVNSTNISEPTQIQPDQQQQQEEDETLLLNLLSEQIKSKFDRNEADSIIARLTVFPAWLSQMIEEPLLRPTLIDLYDAHKGSLLLGLCIRQISAKGYHRELARRIREVDYFEVFSVLITDILRTILRSSSSVSIHELADDIKRICCSSEYMFLFVYKLLGAIAAELSLQTSGEYPVENFYRIKRLRQELEDAAIWNNRDGGTGRLKNEAIFALKLTGMFSKQQEWETSSSSRDHVFEIFATEISDALIENNLKKSHIDRLIDALTKSSQSRSTSTPALSGATLALLRHHAAVSMLIDAFMHPQKQLLECSAGVAKLLAIVAVWTEAVHNDEVGSVEVKLVLVKELCTEIMKSAYGVLKLERSRQLVTMVETSSLLSLCVLHWASALARDEAFTSKEAFLMLLPTLLHTVATAASSHPSQRSDCFSVLKCILLLSPSSTSASGEKDRIQQSSETYTIVSALKDAAECLVYLMGNGFVEQPMQFLLAHCQEFDGVLLRYLVFCVLDTAKSPLSVDFYAHITSLLKKPSVTKALATPHFAFGIEKLRSFHSTLVLSSEAGGAKDVDAMRGEVGEIVSAVETAVVPHVASSYAPAAASYLTGSKSATSSQRITQLK